MIFDIENWLWKSNFGTFWHLPTTPIHKIQQFPLDILFLTKNLSNFVSLTWKLHNRYCHNEQKFFPPWSASIRKKNTSLAKI